MSVSLSVLVAAAAPLLIVGCAAQPSGPQFGVMLPGTIYAQDGTVMPFAIEKTAGSGLVEAVNHTTNERLSGRYTAVIQGAVGGSNAYITNGTRAAIGVGSTAVRSNLADAMAYLRGDKGTMLTCTMQIQPGDYPHGIGTCSDNRGLTYRLQF